MCRGAQENIMERYLETAALAENGSTDGLALRLLRVLQFLLNLLQLIANRSQFLFQSVDSVLTGGCGSGSGGWCGARSAQFLILNFQFVFVRLQVLDAPLGFPQLKLENPAVLGSLFQFFFQVPIFIGLIFSI